MNDWEIAKLILFYTFWTSIVFFFLLAVIVRVVVDYVTFFFSWFSSRSSNKAKIEERTHAEINIKNLQVKLPWTVKYSEDFRLTPLTHKDFSHALHHVSKAVGKLHGLADDMDHNKELALSLNPDDYGKYIADLVVCALRLANTFPGRIIDLESEVIKRIETKNGVRLR
ncbi:hypothetical protein [Leptospira kirschneri]|uniref:hypothetical protein n=1 Tax=Leptospira kirschneri TaxID=29507 RepID=UPI0002FCD8CB|nr:hypothetical protein [Leptospira kirschneri]